MNNENLLTPGEKIKKIRRDFKIKQVDITGGKITRNLVSLIENNRADLTVSTAEIITSFINGICEERDIDFKMTPDDLLKNNTIQADKMLNDLIDEINHNMDDKNFDFSNIIDKAEKLIKENPFMDKITDLYVKLGDIFRSRNDFRKAYIFYLKVYEHLDFYKDKALYALISVSLTYCCNNLYEFSETIQIVNTILSLNFNIDESLKYKLLYNKAIAQRNTNKFGDALNSLNQIDENIISDNIFNIKTLKANCYTELKLYKDALDIHLNLLNNYCKNNQINKLVALTNIIDIYKYLDDKTGMRKYLIIAMTLITNNKIVANNYFLDSIYYDLAVSNIFIENEKDALILLNKALLSSKIQKKYKVEYDCISSMFEIYYKREDYQKLNELKILLLELLSKSNKHEFHTLVYEYIKMYDKQGKRAELEDLVNFMINLNKKAV